MPEFMLDHGSIEASRQFRKLDMFTQSYIEAIFWTDASPDNDDCADATLAELSAETLAAIVDDCRDFQASNVELLEQAYATNYDAAHAGMDFWLTRNGHGAGFWDRGLGKIGEELTKNAKPYGTQSLCRGDDDYLYLM